MKGNKRQKQHKSKKEAQEKDHLGSLPDFIKPTKGYKDKHGLEQESSDPKSSFEMEKSSSGKRKASRGN